MTPDDRWARLTKLTQDYQHKTHEEYFQVGRFVGWLSQALAQYCGCPAEKVFSYAYDVKKEEFAGPVRTGWKAVSKADDGFWEFGMAVELETAPNASPKIRPQWLVRVKPSTQPQENWFCQLGVGDEKIIEISSSSFNLDKVCEQIFDGVTAAFRNEIDGKPARIGFLYED